MKPLTVNEEMLLVSILRLQYEAYGVKIREKIMELTGNPLHPGTLYNTLDQIIKKGYVESKKGEPTFRRGGHNKVYYSLTRDGAAALEKSRELHSKLWEGLPQNVCTR